MERSDGHETLVSFESRWSSGYDCGLRCDKWEISVNGRTLRIIACRARIGGPAQRQLLYAQASILTRRANGRKLGNENSPPAPVPRNERRGAWTTEPAVGRMPREESNEARSAR
jgi:hypothetical protein